MKYIHGSGFEKIEREMLSFSNSLTSVLEVFRSMMNVGANWCASYWYKNPPVFDPTVAKYDASESIINKRIVEEFAK